MTTPGAPDSDAAEAAKVRLREDLRVAMLARDPPRVRVLRALIATLDNAQAVPLGDRHDRYVVHAFGDRSAEAPRLRLTADAVAGILAAELATRRSAAADFTALDQAERAEALLKEAEVVAAYVDVRPD